MKIILLKDVAKVGRRYEVKELADGYARNFIIARGLGMMADQKNLKKLEELKKKVGVTKQPEGVLLAKQLEGLKGLKVHLKSKANPEGHLFAGIHPDQIAKQLQIEQGINFPPESIILDKAIKSVGEHSVKIKIADQVGQFSLVVEAL
jgi:large subunit ribosomal protein L9